HREKYAPSIVSSTSISFGCLRRTNALTGSRRRRKLGVDKLGVRGKKEQKGHKGQTGRANRVQRHEAPSFGLLAILPPRNQTPTCPSSGTRCRPTSRHCCMRAGLQVSSADCGTPATIQTR